MKHKLNPFVIAVVLILLIVVLALISQFEKTEITTHSGLKGEARTNPLYANRLFLKRMGIPTETIQSTQALKTLPSTNTVIYLDANRTSMSPQMVDDLLDWVKRGGHLVTIADLRYRKDQLSDSTNYDHLQKELKIYVNHHVYLDDDEASNPPEKKADKTFTEASWAVTLGERSYNIQPDFFRALESEWDDEVINVGNDGFLINIALDDGLISLASHLDFLQQSLDDHDHAAFFYALIRYHHDSPTNVWLISNSNMPSLWSLLWHHLPLLMISLLILFVASVYAIGLRLGPIIPKPSLSRRRLMEHIEASGYFLWKHRQQSLIDSNRKALNQYIAKQYGAWAGLSKSEQIAYIQAQTEWSQDKIKQLLFDELITNDEAMSEERFTHWMQQLEHIKKKIQP